MKTISFINLKGGVGKTTVSVNFAYAAASMYNAKILFIDNDKQGNATDWLRKSDGPDEKEYGSITHILMGDVTAENIQEVIQPTTNENIDLIAGDMGIIEAHAKLLKSDDVNQTMMIHDALKNVQDKYDLCVIDNPPDINLSVFNTLLITDDVIIVTTTEKDSLDGMYLMLQQVNSLQQYNPALNIKGLLINQYITSPETYELLERLKNEGIPVFKSRIRYASKKAKSYMDMARKSGLTLLEKSPNCHVSRDIVKFTKEFFGVR